MLKTGASPQILAPCCFPMMTLPPRCGGCTCVQRRLIRVTKPRVEASAKVFMHRLAQLRCWILVEAVAARSTLAEGRLCQGVYFFGIVSCIWMNPSSSNLHLWNPNPSNLHFWNAGDLKTRKPIRRIASVVDSCICRDELLLRAVQITYSRSVRVYHSLCSFHNICLNLFWVHTNNLDYCYVVLILQTANDVSTVG